MDEKRNKEENEEEKKREDKWGKLQARGVFAKGGGGSRSLCRRLSRSDISQSRPRIDEGRL